MSTITKVAVFYDGNFFAHVSNYYAFTHNRRARINLTGLHELIRHRVSVEEQIDLRYTQIVDAHYYRGRRTADEANLHGERQFDTVLMRAGVVTHYLPLARGGEKGIDVLLALEAYEGAITKRYDVLALVAGDSDFVPLIRKLAIVGTRVMIVGFDAKFIDQNNKEQVTRTAQALLDVATYPVMVSTMIDDRSSRRNTYVDDLFVTRASTVPQGPVESNNQKTQPTVENTSSDADTLAQHSERITGKIKVLKEGYGFITRLGAGGDVFFHSTHLVDRDFSDLQPAQWVSFTVAIVEGKDQARAMMVLEGPPDDILKN